MSVNRLKRRRADDLHAGPSVSRKLSSHSGVKKVHGDEKYRRQMYSSSVQDALRKKSEGDSSKYDQILRRFASASALQEPDSTQEVQLLINALSHVVSQLDRRHKSLVTAIIALPWASTDAGFVKSYTSFMGLLLSAQSQYGKDVLERAVEGLTHYSDSPALNLGSEASGNRLTRGDLYDRYHQLLEGVLTIVPTLSQSLHQVIARKFPHKSLEKVFHVTYTRNILRIATYCPGLANQIISSIVEQAIQIDVECQVDIEELEASGETFNAVFDLDPFESEVTTKVTTEDESDEEDQERASELSSEDEGDLDDVPVIEEAPRDHAHLSDMAMKLDAILSLLLDYLGAPWQAPTSDVVTSPEDDERFIEVQSARFRALLFTFERIVLHTAKTRYTQFLLFWYSSLDTRFAEDFLGLLLKKAIHADETPATRAAAASYIASFVSRARFVDGEGVRLVIRLLCTYLGSELEQYAEQKEAVHISHFTSFYSAAQAVFLIFCFRWRDLQEEQEEQDHEEENDDLGLNAAAAGPKRTKWITELDIVQKVVVSPLNPLKFCDESVVDIFAQVAAKSNFTSCYSILEQNRRTAFNGVTPSYILPALSSVGSNAGGRPEPNRSQSAPAATPSTARSVFAASNPSMTSTTTTDTANSIMELNGFFPFDPYDLHQSRSYIDPIYRVWADVAIKEDDGEEEEDANTEDEEEEGSLVNSPSNGSAASLPLVFGSHQEARTSADELGKSFGGMSISPVRQVDMPKSFLSLRA